MKARSSSPVHVHVNEITPVYVHVQRSKSLPASIEKSHVVISASATDPGSMSTKKEGKKRTVHKKDRTPQQSHKERTPQESTITSRQAEKICSVIHSSDFDFKKDALDRHGYGLRVEMEGPGHEFLENRRKDFLEEVSEELISTRTEDVELAADLTGYSTGLENRTQGSIRLHNSPSTLLGDLQMNRLGKDVHAEDKKSLLKTLIEAEMAANSAEIQLVSFKDSVAEYSDDGRLANQDVMRMSRQRNLLLEKLDNFKVINKTLRHLLKDLQGEEAGRLQADKHVEVLLKKLTEAESENMHLRRRIDEKERIIEELRDMRQKDRDNTDTVVQLSKSVEATRAHLQGQLRNKESENNRMTVQLRGLEQTVTERKLEIEHLKSQMSHVKEKADQEKEALKKAARAQKQRALRFERAVEKLQDQLNDKDMKLTEACSAANTWRSHQEQSTEEKAQLEAKVTTLQHQITDLIEQLQKARDCARISNEDILQKIEAVNSESANLNLENARLKASIAALEEQATRTEAELKEQKENADQHKDFAEQYKTKVKDLQKEAEELKTRFEHVLKENELSKDSKETEVSKVENQTKLLESSREKNGLLHKENLELQLKLDAIHRKIEDVQSENQKLVQQLSRQEEALHYSGKQLEERSAQSLALTRQLEAALADVRKQVTDLKEKASDKERALQSKILELETENSRREKELKQMKQANKLAENQFELRLKDLQLNLDQSESHKQSIQNYVEFLKKSYDTMFGEGILPNRGTSSFF
ncbi:protein BCAP-like isoform X1 [Polyodon spathula]|uniref:protein BCAP-like isoform X1 n=1 Tax=Polyodon spathula TaxID=7913 RepID=UPI001B7E0595|nr:protein BCAP-like isoform X1 [Polyodon spathula]